MWFFELRSLAISMPSHAVALTVVLTTGSPVIVVQAQQAMTIALIRAMVYSLGYFGERRRRRRRRPTL
ncbi:hypothetical protein NIES39_M01140 [Arthrospira platensis NIES-39]|nr:hypothetical protein NIES39_M01140 [Arthrospira platensis NIES-39]